MKTTLLILSIFASTLCFGQQVITGKDGKDYVVQSVMDSNKANNNAVMADRKIKSLRLQLTQAVRDSVTAHNYCKSHRYNPYFHNPLIKPVPLKFKR